MSIFSQLLDHRIGFGQAVQEGGQWFDTILAKAPPAVQADVTQGLSDFKQAASNAVALADTMLGPILSAGTLAVEAAANTALVSATAGAGSVLTPALDAGISQVANALHAEIDAVAARVRANLLGTPPAS